MLANSGFIASKTGTGNPSLVLTSDFKWQPSAKIAAGRFNESALHISKVSLNKSGKETISGVIRIFGFLSTLLLIKSSKVIVSVRMFAVPKIQPRTGSWPNVCILWYPPSIFLPIAGDPFVIS